MKSTIKIVLISSLVTIAVTAGLIVDKHSWWQIVVSALFIFVATFLVLAMSLADREEK
ncbi:MAG: hypothetical protein ACOX0C_02410 [Patescibacteria group bacterium]|jgi:uncharacterized membrane protein YoaK (UPF0700 family)